MDEMTALERTKIGYGAIGKGLSGYAVADTDLTLLLEAIDRWDKFLGRMFILPTTGTMMNDLLDQIKLEDADCYLDVKIQLSQCLKAVDNPLVEQQLLLQSAEIRKLSYHLIETTLPYLAENNRTLIELGQKDDHGSHDLAGANTGSAVSPDLQVSQEYKDCLVQQRKQLKTDVIRQRGTVNSQIQKLRDSIQNTFEIRFAGH